MTGQSGSFEEVYKVQTKRIERLERELAEAQARVLEVEQRCGDALLAKVEADDAR